MVFAQRIIKIFFLHLKECLYLNNEGKESIMRILAVFRQGKWIEYSPRCIITKDPRITEPLHHLAASAYVTALQKGFQEEWAHVLAEAVAFRKVYPELVYNDRVEKDLKSLWVAGEKHEAPKK